MILFEKRFHEGLTSGAITATFRRWRTARVKVGGRYRCHPIGVLEVDAVEATRFGALRARDAKNAGFSSLAEMKAYIATAGEVDASTELWCIRFHHGGDGDRVQIALDDRLTPEDVEELTRSLAKLDRRRAWTAETLEHIRAHPRVAASKLAAALGRERLAFKTDVRKLKTLGLTQSFEVGYELSPRGIAYWNATHASVARAPRRRKP